MSELKVVVSGPVGTGKSHVLAIIERALRLEYGPDIEVICQDTADERNSIGRDISEWQQPNVDKIVMLGEVIEPQAVLGFQPMKPLNGKVKYLDPSYTDEQAKAITYLAENLIKLTASGSEMVSGDIYDIVMTFNNDNLLVSQYARVAYRIPFNIEFYSQNTDKRYEDVAVFRGIRIISWWSTGVGKGLTTSVQCKVDSSYHKTQLKLL
jgi:hypothetical protein